MANFRKIDYAYAETKLKIKSKFYYFNKNFESFDKLTDEKRDELKKEAIFLKNRYIDNEKIGQVYYNILIHIKNDIEKNKKYTPEEAIALLIETVDPKLKSLKISMKNKTNFDIESDINDILGFYDIKLIDYEREYAKRFNKSSSKILMKKLETKYF